MATVEQILDASKESKRLTRMAKWQTLTALIHQHIDEAYMLGEETGKLHTEAFYKDELKKVREESAYWRKWYAEALHRLRCWERYHAEQRRNA